MSLGRYIRITKSYTYLCNSFSFTGFAKPLIMSLISESQLDNLLYASKMSAKVDNSAIQDNYFLYHHNIAFDSDGDWSIIQQGMTKDNKTARRYQWFSKSVRMVVL
ncbi:DUF763 domain-containing protein [Candidatus Nitrosocosmicus arcticus]|uniref:Uncharacterized protein n=1 Tax=Candidatus Nitrosocosmicus arcticus TaxID=2035267 RepID=A0A557SXY5_9ARCH|nr:DUF763 domain-containing protein [Candidatus Nitrosocosmicus arcticus]TVP41469.1 hypothetical protein NARC_30184 [Candidatus Nitrosocosmicus arcticus]